MLTLYSLEAHKIRAIASPPLDEAFPERAVWIDLEHPSRQEEVAVEKRLGINVPTREDMRSIEESSRLYVEDGALVMTLPVLHRAASDDQELSTVTFIYTPMCLVTLRYSNPSPIGYFAQSLQRPEAPCQTAEDILVGLLEKIAERMAEIMEGATEEIEKLSHEIFRKNGESGAASGTDFRSVIRKIGHSNDLATEAKASGLCFSRLLSFYAAHAKPGKSAAIRLHSVERDIASISEHTTFVSAKVSFLLDATLGLINHEQNNIIKIFSVAAVAFMPPTLIASIYGMNFKQMPELGWAFGYPLALAMMIVFALIPLWYFRRKKWL